MAMNAPIWIDVGSECLSQVAWADDVLYLRFRKSGRCYRYVGVGEGLFRNLVDAPSLGQFFGSEIRPYYPGVPM